MTETQIRQFVEEMINELLEEDSAFASTDASSAGSGMTDGVSSDASYVYRERIGEVQKRPDYITPKYRKRKKKILKK
jgi:hypothetical protein